MNDAHSHDEQHTGHGGHHILERPMLIRTFLGLVFLTVLTVALALMERADILPLGALSVPVALAIAGAKATLVAAFFMGLKDDGGTNLLAFGGSIVFLIIFLVFTYFDTGFRDTFQEVSATPIDIQEDEARALEARQAALEARQDVQPLVAPADTLLFPNAPIAP